MPGLLYYLYSNPLVRIAAAILWLWMLVDAIRRSEWLWAVFMVCFPGLTTLFYFFFVFRATASATQGFELPGASRRSRIRELERLIHDLDKPHHFLELGDIYFQKGNLSKAEECYRASLARDAQDIDARAHLGQCLLRQKKAGEARPILQQVCAENPKHDYGHSLMAYAETLASLGETDNAIAVWKQVLQDHTYARARVQLGELYLAAKQPELAAAQFREAISDDRHAPGYQHKRDRVWIWRAKRLLP
jgi:tetratricopeptide (TPR) repeat protein